MSTSVPPEQSPTPAPSSAPTGSPSPTPSVSAPPAEPYRFGNDVPQAWARGKTAAEILGLVERQNQVLEGFARNAPSAPPQPQYTPSAPPQYVPPGAEDYVNGAQMAQYAEQFASRQNQDMQHVINSNADMALDAVKREFPTHFSKYGPEITANLASLTDKRAWTLDNLRKVVKFTLVDHVDDLARERAAQIAAEMEPTLRSTGAGGHPINRTTTETTLQSDQLPSEWKERAASAGLTESALDEFCRANDMSRADWFKLFGKTVITEGSPR